jgi:hypothetical protein
MPHLLARFVNGLLIAAKVDIHRALWIPVFWRHPLGTVDVARAAEGTVLRAMIWTVGEFVVRSTVVYSRTP